MYMESRSGLMEVASNAITKFTNDVDFKDVSGTFLRYFENQQYSQCGKLMREGKLGEVSFLGGSLIEGMFKSHQLTVEANTKRIAIAAALISEIVKSQKQYNSQLVALEERRLKVFEDAQKKYFHQTNRVMEKYMTSTDPKAEENAIKMLEQLRLGYERVLNFGNTVIGQNQLAEVKKANDVLIKCMMSTISEVGKQEADSLNKIIEGSTDLLKGIFKTFIPGRGNEPSATLNNGSNTTEQEKLTHKSKSSPKRKAVAEPQKAVDPEELDDSGDTEPVSKQQRNSHPTSSGTEAKPRALPAPQQASAVDSDDLDKTYRTAKSNYRQLVAEVRKGKKADEEKVGKFFESADTLFGASYSKYKKLGSSDEKVNKRLAKLKNPDGKYSPTQLLEIKSGSVLSK